jgi:Glycosyl transferase family 11
MITYRHLGRNGQLGNQLWQIASTVGIAHREGNAAAFPFWRYRPYFSVPDALFPDRVSAHSRDLGLDYLQDLENFGGIEDEIHTFFAPRPEVWTRLAARFDGVLSLPHKTSLHVRRGDYLGHNGFFVNLPVEYYLEAMSLTQGPYLVFSDDLAWCRANLPGDCLFMERNRDYEDLFLMAACDEHIVANSTFSWWGAYIGGGRAVMPREWGLAFGGPIEPRFVMPNCVVLDVPPAEEGAA